MYAGGTMLCAALCRTCCDRPRCAAHACCTRPRCVASPILPIRLRASPLPPPPAAPPCLTTQWGGDPQVPAHPSAANCTKIKDKDDYNPFVPKESAGGRDVIPPVGGLLLLLPPPRPLPLLLPPGALAIRLIDEILLPRAAGSARRCVWSPTNCAF